MGCRIGRVERVEGVEERIKRFIVFAESNYPPGASVESVVVKDKCNKRRIGKDGRSRECGIRFKKTRAVLKEKVELKSSF